jgi:hypothetical protein
MISSCELRGLRNIADAILKSALTDAIKGHESVGRLEAFAESDWCEQLCEVAYIPIPAYKRELARRIEKNIEDSKPKRLRTHELAGVLNEDSRTNKAERVGKVCKVE